MDSKLINKLEEERKLALETLKSISKSKSPSLNISELYTDHTIEMITDSGTSSFTPDEMTARSTELGMNGTDSKGYLTPGLEEIFRNSFCDEVKQMEDRWRQSVDGRTSILTADLSAMSLENKKRNYSFDRSQSGMSRMSEEFQSADKQLKRLELDQREWEKEFAIIPSTEPEQKTGDSQGAAVGAADVRPKLRNYAELSDFSGYLSESSRRSESDMSVNGFFRGRSENLHQMIPNKSPPRRTTYPLVDMADITMAEKENENPQENIITPSKSKSQRTFTKHNDDPRKTMDTVVDAMSPYRQFQGESQLASSPRSLVTLENSEDELLFIPHQGPSNRALSLPNTSPSKLVRTASQWSSNSEFSHRDGVFPIKASHLKLSWGCVRLRTPVKMGLKLKNCAGKRVTFRLTITGAGYQFIAMESGMLTLQPFETHSLAVEFCPTVIGPAIGQIVMEPPNASSQQCKIQLFGFGGKAAPELTGDVCVPPTGNPFIEISSLRDLRLNMQKYLIVRNRGNIAAFAIFSPDYNAAALQMDNAHIYPEPPRVVVPAGKSVTVQIKISLTKQDLMKLFKKQRGRVVKLTTMYCFMGDNVTRLRIKKCISKVRENPDRYSRNESYKTLIESDSFQAFLDADTGDPAAEIDKFDDEPMESIRDFIQTFTQETIDLTIDRASDETLQVLDDPEMSTAFKTLIWTEPELTRDVLIIEPTELEMIPMRAAQFYLMNVSDRLETFEIETDFVGGLECFPAEGQIEPDEKIAINAKLKFAMPPSRNLKITVKFEKGKVELPVSILPEGLPAFLR